MKHLFTLSEWLRAKWERFATLASSAMQSLKATKRQSDTTIFAESVKVSKFRETFAKSLKSLMSIFANRGVKDVRVSLGQYRTDYQRISNLYLTPNRFFTRFAAVFALVFVLGVGNVWGANPDPVLCTFPSSGSITNNSITVNSVTWSIKTTVGAGSPSVALTNATYASTSKSSIKFGSSKKIYYSSFSLSTNYFSSYNVSAVNVHYALNGGATTTVTATQGNTTIGSDTYSTGQTWHDATMNTSKGTGGELTISFTTTQAIAIHSIEITYTAAASGYSITYHCNGATSGCPSNASGQTKLPATLPTPSKTGCIFAGWYTNEGLTTATTAGATLSADANLYAKWTTNVTLNRNGVTETINDVVVGTDLDEIDGSGDQGGCSAWTFVGWSKTQRAAQNVSTEMTLVTEIDGPGPYYAVYSHTESGGGMAFARYSQVALGGTITAGKYLISTGSYTMAGSGKTGVSLTPSTTEAASREYTVAIVSGTTITIKGPDNKYIGGTDKADGLTFDTSTPSTDAYRWVYTNNGIQNKSITSRHIKAYGTTDFRHYGTSNGVITYFYKRIEEESSTTYYSTAANCCQPLGQINGSFKLTQNSASARAFSWTNETTVADVDHYELSYKEKTAEGDPTPIANNITNSTHAYTHEANLTEGKTYTYYLKAVGASGHCDATEEVDVLIPFATSTVTFNDNGKTSGSVPDAITQNTGTTVTVPGNTGNLAKDNYAFGGWNTKDDGTGTNYVADATFTLSNDITLYAKWDCAKKVTLTKGTPSNGSFSLSEANGDKYTCDGSVVVTVSDITPTSGYRLVGITQTGMESGVTINQENKTVTYAQYANGSSTINVEFEQIPVHTITWMVNGAEYTTGNPTTSVVDGNGITALPTTPTSCNTTTYGTFVGWYTTAAGSDSEPSNAVSGTKAVINHVPTGNETYYAVWANGALSADEVKQVTLDFTDNSEWGFPTDYVNSTKENSYTNSYTVKLAGSGAASTGYKWNSSTSALIIGKEDAYLKLPAFSFATSKIVVTGPASGASGKVTWNTFVGDDAVSTEVTGSNANHTFNIASANQAAGNVYAFKVTNDNNLQIKTIEVYSPGVGATAFISTCCTKHNVSISDGLVNGSVTSSLASACEGTSVTLTATPTPNAGRFKTWSITGLDSYSTTTNPLTFDMPDNDITVSATFDALYAITKELVHGSFDIDKNYAIAGETVTISNVAADAQYENPQLEVYYIENEVKTTVSLTNNTFLMPAHAVKVKVSCSPAIQPLDAPVLGEATDATYQGVTLNWTGVAGNEGYVLTVQQGGVDVEGLVNVAIAQNATSYTIASGLAANTDYTYSIYTKGNGTTTMEVNTPANGNFSTVDYPNVTFYYSENGTLSAGESKKILTDFELADPVSDPCTKKFVGWSTETVAETDVEPAMMAPGATYQIPTNANCTIYAVYATEVPGAATQWTIEKADLEVLDSQQSSAYDKYKGDQSKSGITYNIADVMPGATQGHSGDLQIKKSSGKLYNKTAFNKDIISIVITGADISVFEGTSEISSTPASGAISATGSGPYTYTFSSGKRYFHIQNATNSAAYPSSITVNVAGSTTYAAYATTCAGKVATPSFSGVTDSETYEENKTVSLGCATGEATIRYTMSNDGTTPADPTGESTAATSISLNADGVYVIKAKAFKDGMDASDVATISVTINKPCTTIAEFIAATPKSAKKLVFTAESNAVVLGVNTNRIYIQDPTGGLLLYKTAHEKTWTKGKKVVGTVIGTYAEVDNAPRMLVTDFGETVATIDGEIPSAVVIEGAINANFAANRNKLVTISDLHFQAQSVGGGNSINITRGDDTYQIYNAFNALNDHVLPLTETACSVTGILGYHSNKYQLMPIDANCITTGATAVLPEFVGETGGADAEHPTEVASGEVIKLTAAEGMTSNYTIGESAPVSITTNTEAVISGANNDLIAITISAEREYYTDNSVTYYYKINNALTKYIITSAVVENGTFKVKNSDASAEITSAVAGATVTLVAEPTHTETAQYSLDHWTVYETGNTSNTVSVENNQFMMPSFAVTVSATFAEDAYATVVFDGGDATGTAPASEKKYVGQEVTMPNKGALVKADHVLASWTYNETEYAVGDTYEIQAGDAAIGGNEITFTANWTPYPWANGGDWMLVTDAAEVTAGSYVIIAAAASNVAMSTTQNNNNRAQQSISKTDNTLTYDETAPAIFEVRAGNIENTLAFYDVVKEGYIYAASSSSNYLRTETTLSDNSSWTIGIDDNEAALVAQGTNTRNTLRHNNGSSIFSCYGSSSSESPIALYKYYAPVPKVTYDKNTEDEVTNMPNPSVQRAENNKATIAAGPSRTGYTFEGWKNGNTTYTVGEEYTFTEDITLYAQWEALPSFHVTYNTSGSQGTTPTDATNYYEGDPVTLASASGLSNAGYFFDQWVATYVDNNSETQTLVIEDGKFTMPAFNVTVTATWARKSSDKWIKVTATSQLAADKEYIIVNTDATYAVGAQGSNNRTAAAIEENNGILTISDAVAKFTLGIPEAGKYTFYQNGTVDNVDKGYLYAANSSSNYMRTQTTNDANGVWTISIGEGGAATITATGENKRNIMRYNPNNGSPVFSCYASNSSVQNPVVLYYKAPKIEINDNESVNVSDAAGSDIVIHEGGILTVDASASIGDLTVEAGGQVVLDANKLTVVGTFTIETTMASGESGQLNGATELNFEAQEDAYIDITLGDNGNPEKWHAFTVPFPVDAINGIYDLDGKKLVNEVNYAIMDYHGDIRATGNYGWKKYRGVLVPGTFYLMTVDGLRTTYRFKKTANGAIVAGNTKQLYEYASSTGNNDNGWNGVGNPTLMYGTVDQNVQVLNPVSYTYEPYTAGNQNFVVGTPFFVQAASDGTMTMGAVDGEKPYYAPTRVQANEIKDVKVTFGNEEYTDKLYISASEDALNEYETGKDLAKMTMTSTPKVAQIFGKAYNAKLCMVYAPMINDQAVYDLTLYAPANGEYTIAAPNVENADLYLTYEGSIIWDLTMGAYTNNFAKGNNEGYGLLLQAKMPMTPTGVDEVQSDKVQCTKVVIDEHVYILRGGEMYDVTGKAVK